MPIRAPEETGPANNYVRGYRLGKRVFQRLLSDSPTPERCVEVYHLHRTRFEQIAERKVRRRQLTEDGNIEISGRDLREKTPPTGQRNFFERLAAPSF